MASAWIAGAKWFKCSIISAPNQQTLVPGRNIAQRRHPNKQAAYVCIPNIELACRLADSALRCQRRCRRRTGRNANPTVCRVGLSAVLGL